MYFIAFLLTFLPLVQHACEQRHWCFFFYSHWFYFLLSLINHFKVDIVLFCSHSLFFSSSSSSDLQKSPELVSGALAGKRVVHAAGGYSFSVAVTDDGEVYAWGFNDKFQV